MFFIFSFSLSIAVQSLSISDLPHHVLSDMLLPSLFWNERRILRELNRAYHDLYCRVYPNQCIKMSKFHKFSIFLSTLNSSSNRIYSRIKHKADALRLNENQTKQDMVYIETLLVDVVYSSDSVIKSKAIWDVLILYFNVDLSRHCELHEMMAMMTHTLSHRLDSAALHRMFSFAMRECNKTSLRYNRYTRYALLHLDCSYAVRYYLVLFLLFFIIFALFWL